jgi:hypothetical protein
MSDVVEFTMEKTEYFASPGLGFLETSNSRAKTIAMNYINELCRKS